MNSDNILSSGSVGLSLVKQTNDTNKALLEEQIPRKILVNLNIQKGIGEKVKNFSFWRSNHGYSGEKFTTDGGFCLFVG